MSCTSTLQTQDDLNKSKALVYDLIYLRNLDLLNDM